MTAPAPAPEPIPSVAADVFGAALPQAERYALALAGPAIERGLIGPAEASRVWGRHLLNCAPLAGLIAADARVVDVGSGAGLPGLVVALLRPDLEVLLVDAQARRCTFLTEMVDELHLAPRVTVQQARAEELAGTIRADCVAVRALAPLVRLIPLCAPLLRPNGEILAIKGASAAAELAAAEDSVRAYDARAEIRAVALPDGSATTTVVRVEVRRPQRRGDRPTTARMSRGARNSARERR